MAEVICSREPIGLKNSRYGTGTVFYEQAEEMYIKIISSCHIETVVLMTKNT